MVQQEKSIEFEQNLRHIFALTPSSIKVISPTLIYVKSNYLDFLIIMRLSYFK